MASVATGHRHFAVHEATIASEIIVNADSKLKMFMLQDSFWDQIQGVRNRELKTLWHSFVVGALNAFLFNFIPVLVSVLTFTTYVALGHPLTAAEAFTSLSLFTVRARLMRRLDLNYCNRLMCAGHCAHLLNIAEHGQNLSGASRARGGVKGGC